MEDQEKNNNEVIKDEKVDVEDTTNKVDNTDSSGEVYPNKPTNKVVDWFKKVGAWFKGTWEKLEKKLGIKNLVIIGYATLAVILVILIVSLSVVSVRYNKVSNGTLNGNTINGAGSNNSAAVSQKEEQLFTTWKEGMNATAKYDGAYSIVSKLDSTTLDSGVKTRVSTEEINEVLLDDGQYIYKYNWNDKRYNADSQETGSASTVKYNAIIKDGEQYKEFSDGKDAYYAADEYSCKIAEKPCLSQLQSVKCEGIWVASSDSFKNATNKLTAFITRVSQGSLLVSSSVEISEENGAIVLLVKYTLVENDASAIVNDTTEIKYFVKDGKVVKVEEKRTIDGKEVDNNATTKVESETTTTVEYKLDTDTFNQLKTSLTIPTTKTALMGSVNYYINDYCNSQMAEVGEPLDSLIYSRSVDWYLDKDYTTLYTNEKVKGGDALNLYGKIKTPSASQIYLVFTDHIDYKYPDFYPELIKKDSLDRWSQVYDLDSVDDCKTIVANNIYNGSSKYTINGVDYTKDELDNFNFELGNTYIIVVGYSTYSGLYS